MEKKNEWWFFVNGFMDFMREEFPNPLSNHFTYDLLENIVNKLISLTDDRNQLTDWLEDIIPEVKREEIEQWFNR